MGLEANPYQSPPDVETETIEGRPEGAVWGWCLWVGVGFACVGFVSNFIPNWPPLGFLLIALVLFLVAVTGSKKHRKRAIVALVLGSLLAIGNVFFLRLTYARVQRDRAMRAQMEARDAAKALEESVRSKSQTNLGE